MLAFEFVEYLIVKGISFFDSTRLPRLLFFSLILTLIVYPVVCAQTEVLTATPEPTPTLNGSAPDTSAAPRRIARARSLAAVGRLAAAASELESLRASSTDDPARDVARILLMWIFVEMPDYTRANALLEETFKERASSPSVEAATISYYTLAGQTINGIRAHLERFRTFGINIADSDLPAEAVTDLDQLRVLLERLVEHAKMIHREEEAKSAAGKSMEATALLEDAASVRLRLVRNEQERTRWQSEISEARQRLVASETRIASISSVSLNRPSPASGAASSAATKSDAAKKSSAPERARDGVAKATSTPAAQSAPNSPSPTTGAQTNAPVSIGSLLGIARQKSAPAYPAIARAARVSGIVTVHLIVNEKGEVESVLRADGPEPLQVAASDAARRWKFHPTVINGQSTRVTGYISFNFSL